MRTLDRPGLEKFSAGLALQAYLPDSSGVQRRIVEWAQRRVAAGGAPVVIRLVKGANMEAERVEAAVRGWSQAPYKSKSDTDANYKRMLNRAFDPDALEAVGIGIASHNLFDVAYGVVRLRELSQSRPDLAAGCNSRCWREWPITNAARCGREVANLLLYAPACPRDEFLNAIGYLLRRLDENTGPENFLRHAFRLVPESEEWRRLERGFREAFRRTPQETPRRSQDRLAELSASVETLIRPERPWTEFVNEPDTDFALEANVRWIEQVAGPAPQRTAPRVIPLSSPGNRGEEPNAPASIPPNPLPRWRLALHRRNRPGRRRRPCLRTCRPRRLALPHRRPAQHDTRQVAAELRRARGLLMHVALAEGGKTVTESDPE